MWRPKSGGVLAVMALLVAAGLWIGVRPRLKSVDAPVLIEFAREPSPPAVPAEVRPTPAPAIEVSPPAPPPARPVVPSERTATLPVPRAPAALASAPPIATTPATATPPVTARSAKQPMPEVPSQGAPRVTVPTAPPKTPATNPAFTDRRTLVERPATPFVDTRSLTPPTDAQPLPPRPPQPFDDNRQLVNDGVARPKVLPERPEPVPIDPRLAHNQPLPGACETPTVVTEPLEAGRMHLRITSACRAGQPLSLAYDRAVLARRFNSAGVLDLILDLFAGEQPATVTFNDGTRQIVPTRGRDIERIDKVAIIWSPAVDLDLHAFEYGAATGQPGHISAATPSHALAARQLALATGRGRGFISTSDRGDGPGDKIEVYTFFSEDGARRGPITIGVDYASRGAQPQGAACGQGALARITFESLTFERGQLVRRTGEVTPAPCGSPLPSDRRLTLLPQQQNGAR